MTLEQILLQSKLNKDNPALYQVIQELIKQVKSLTTRVSELESGH
jgi:hypothetical protein